MGYDIIHVGVGFLRQRLDLFPDNSRDLAVDSTCLPHVNNNNVPEA